MLIGEGRGAQGYVRSALILVQRVMSSSIRSAGRLKFTPKMDGVPHISPCVLGDELAKQRGAMPPP